MPAMPADVLLSNVYAINLASRSSDYDSSDFSLIPLRLERSSFIITSELLHNNLLVTMRFCESSDFGSRIKTSVTQPLTVTTSLSKASSQFISKQQSKHDFRRQIL
jgi:hypothetical protein